MKILNQTLLCEEDHESTPRNTKDGPKWKVGDITGEYEIEGMEIKVHVSFGEGDFSQHDLC